LTSIKIRIRRALPASIFNIVYAFWKNGLKHVVALEEKFRLLGFKSETVKTVSLGSAQFRILLDPQNGFIDNYIYLHGVYEDYILEVISAHLPEGGVFVDVGANIGQHALFAAAQLKGAGKVYAFEPLPRLYQQFARSIELNGFQNIEAFNFACGAADAEKILYSNRDNAGQSSLVNEASAEAATKVTIKKLDDVLKLPRLDCIKIDVEGFEYEVLLGSQELIRRTKPVIILEFSPNMYNSIDSRTSLNLLDLLSKDYKIYDIEAGGIEVSDNPEFIKSLASSGRIQTNTLFIAKNETL
jgi:FkbM family methyltransferase